MHGVDIFFFAPKKFFLTRFVEILKLWDYFSVVAGDDENDGVVTVIRDYALEVRRHDHQA